MPACAKARSPSRPSSSGATSSALKLASLASENADPIAAQLSSVKAAQSLSGRVLMFVSQNTECTQPINGPVSLDRQTQDSRQYPNRERISDLRTPVSKIRHADSCLTWAVTIIVPISSSRSVPREMKNDLVTLRWCGRSESNRHSFWERHFECRASTSSATPAIMSPKPLSALGSYLAPSTKVARLIGPTVTLSSLCRRSTF